MKKNINKILKTIIILGIIFSNVMVSFCDSSVDSGAFITKEEFDKKLADFNDRLSSVEAGINSKIDTQVTSYLDRNGIWTGLEQTFKTADKYFGATGLQPHADTRWGASWYYDTTSAGYRGETFTDIHRPLGYYTADAVIIENITKSGLMMISFHGEKSGNPMGIMMDNNDTAGTTGKTVYADNCTYNFVEKVNFYSQPLTGGTEKLLSGIALLVLVPVPGLINMVDYPLTFLNFFVQKNTKLIVKFGVDSNIKDAGIKDTGILCHKWYGNDVFVY